MFGLEYCLVWSIGWFGVLFGLEYCLVWSIVCDSVGFIFDF